MATKQLKKKPKGKTPSPRANPKKVKKPAAPVARKKPVVKKPTVKKAVVKKVVATKKPAAKKPAIKKPPVKKAVVKKVVKTAVVKKPPVKKTAVPPKTKKQKVEKQVQEKKPVVAPIEPTKRTRAKKPVATPPPPPVVEEAPPAPTPPVKTKPYLNNRDLVAEVKSSKQQQQMTNKLAKMLMLMCSRYAKKGNFVNYSYNEDMQGYALMMLVRTWNAYDPEKSNNAFAFYTQCIKHSFIQFLNQEKRQRMIRDLLLVDNGLTPSFGFTDGNDAHIVEDEEEYYTESVVEKIIQEAVVGGEGTGVPEEKSENENDNGFMKF